MDQDKEISAMARISETLDKFNKDEVETVKRILRWAASRYGLNSIENLANSTDRASHATRDTGDFEERSFEDLADLFHAASPKTEADKALVASFWLTTGEKKTSFTGWEVNKELKNLGHGIGNITDALSSLMRRKPALVLQTAKSGTSRQARKKYKLTRAGLDYLRRMTSGESGASN
jgi:hypothetical protein